MLIIFVMLQFLFDMHIQCKNVSREMVKDGTMIEFFG